MTYNKAGRKKTMDDPDTGDWSYSYRADGVLTSQTDPSGTVLNMTYDGLGRVLTRTTGATTLASWTYDPATNKRGLLAQSVAGDVTEAYSYDTLGRLLDVTTTVPDEDDVGDYDFKTAYTYRDDHQIATASFPSTTSGAVSETVTYGYDSRTGLATDLSSSAEGVIVDDTTFTNAGQLAQQLFGPAGADGVATYSYDAATLRLTRSRGGTIAAPGAWQDLRYTFDGNGNVVRVFDDENSNQYQCFAYDKSDRLIDAYTDNTSACNGFTATGDGNYDENYQYSLGGNLTSRTGNGAYTYGDAAHAHAVTALGNGSTFSYDTDGNMITRNLTGEPNQTLAWDVEQRLDTVTVTGGDTTSFLYDADGARVRRQTGDTTSFYPAGGSEYRVTAGGGSPPPTNICYVQASGGGILLTWQNQPGTEVVRNSSGWVTTPPSGTLTYTDTGGSVNDGWLIRRSGVDEICQIYVPGGGGGNPPTNICYVQASGGGILLTWQNQPGTEVVRNSSGWVTTPPSGTLTYTDSSGSVNDGWLIRRSGVDEICQIYVPGGGGGATTVFTHYYTLGDRTVGYTVDGTVTWLWTDQINSTGLTRTDTGVNNVQRYAPWGTIRTDGSLTTDRQYTGQIADDATALLFYNARYYDPNIGRFISPDTIIATPRDGQNYNRYSYVNNNPIRFSDPTGLTSCEGIIHSVVCAVQDVIGQAEAAAMGQDVVPDSPPPFFIEVQSTAQGELIVDFMSQLGFNVVAYADPIINPRQAASSFFQCVRSPRACVQAYVDAQVEPCQTGPRRIGSCLAQVVTFGLETGAAGATAGAGTFSRIPTSTSRLSRLAPTSVADDALLNAGPIPRSLGAASRAEQLARKLNLNIDSPTTRQVLNNLDTDVSSFVSQYRKGSIWRELPGELANMTVAEAIQHSSTARKLLTSRQFAK